VGEFFECEFLKRVLKKMLEEKKIKVSCILRVYNGEKYIRESIDSTLNQTYKDFEFIIIDDGSTDNSVKIIESYKDSRIKLYKNEKNMGLSYATNRGIELAKGEYIALVDSDDVYYNTRLEKQVKYLDENMDVGAVSACWSVNGEKIEYFRENVNIFTILLWWNKDKNNSRYGIPNPLLMVRKDIFIKYGLKYDSLHVGCEDMGMVFELLKVTKIRILQEVMVYYRLHGKNTSFVYQEQAREIVAEIKKRALNLLIDDVDLQNKLMKFLNNINMNDCEINKKKKDILKVNFLGISGFLRIKETERLGIIKTKYYLLNFLPILKVKKKGNTKSYYLMGLRLLKIKC
jgi:glycosyltransferase involved in cell wall biosynthesis